MKKNNKKINSNIITVQNAEGDANTKAEIVVQNQINYTPKVSVIIPVYNVEQYLRECLDSVVNQTLREIEIICVDDGSTDSSLDILKEYAAKDKRVTVIKQENLHAGVARNAGLSVAKGEYLSFLDSDDFFELSMLEEMYEKAIEEHSDIVVCGYTIYDSINNTKTVKTGGSGNLVLGCHSEIYLENLFQLTNPMPWNKMFSSSFVQKHNLFFQNTPIANDLYFVYLAMVFADKVSLLAKAFITYRIFKKDSLSSQRNKYPLIFIDAFRNLKQQLEKNNNFNICIKSFYKEFFGSICWTEKLVQDKATFQKKVTHKLQKDFHIDNPFALPQIYISLTSYPQRISSIHHTIQSLLGQSYKADKVILWLAEEQFPNKEADLPQSLLDLVTKGLEIEWCHDIKSYKKLIPALQKYPDAIIVTADDDIIYPQIWLELLVNAHILHPHSICCHRAFFITQNNENIDSYKNWYRGKYIHPLGMYGIKADRHFVSNRIFYTSGSGALYPPHSLHKDVINEKLFRKLAPTEDDIWYWAMALRNNTSLCLVEDNLGIFQVNKYASQENSLYRLNSQNDTTNKIFVKMFEQYPELKERVLSDTPLIISLTSYPARIKTVHQTIYSLLTQSVKADKVILWLAEEQFPNKEKNLPQELLSLTKIGLEIDWYHDIKSYKKLIPSLKKYPEAIIVTADDDLLYDKNWLENLLVSYTKNPHMLHCHRAHMMNFEKGVVLPYRQWTQNIKQNKTLYNAFPTSGAGVLYPPHCFYKDVLDEEKFMRLCPQADDIWFWTMAVKNNTPIKVVENNITKLNFVDGTQETALWHSNVIEGKNDIQLQNVLKEYPEILDKLDKTISPTQPKNIEQPHKAVVLAAHVQSEPLIAPQLKKYVLSYNLFGFLPLFTYRRRGGKEVWKILSIPFWKVRKMENGAIKKYYFCNLPMLKIVRREQLYTDLK